MDQHWISTSPQHIESDWHIQREVLGESLEVLSGCVGGTVEEIDEYLAVARLHPTGRHWVDNFLLPTLLIHQFERAEREDDYYLKQLTMERMLKYFFLAGHVQYARYLTQYRLEMRHLRAICAPSACGCEEGSCVRCICVSTPRGVLECCLWRPIWRADSHQDGQRSSESPPPPSSLPKRDAIMKSKNNKRKLASVLSTFIVGDMTTTESRDDSAFDHDEADITMILYVIEAAKCGKDVIRVLSDDSDVFVLLVYWVYREEMTSKVQMERWDGTVLDINATCADLGPQCLQLLGMHAISVCGTTSYAYSKGKFSALKTDVGWGLPWFG